MPAALCFDGFAWAFLLGEPSRCQARMMLERVSPGPIGFEHWLFEWPKCDHVETRVIGSDPFKSKTAGWLAGELGRPN
jgi:hypothetical protein